MQQVLLELGEALTGGVEVPLAVLQRVGAFPSHGLGRCGPLGGLALGLRREELWDGPENHFEHIDGEVARLDGPVGNHCGLGMKLVDKAIDAEVPFHRG
eukprot:scaffold1642_cov252-Pinguiococcus_pyrenoidosus.AAC.18